MQSIGYIPELISIYFYFYFSISVKFRIPNDFELAMRNAK